MSSEQYDCLLMTRSDRTSQGALVWGRKVHKALSLDGGLQGIKGCWGRESVVSRDKLPDRFSDSKHMYMQAVLTWLSGLCVCSTRVCVRMHVCTYGSLTVVIIEEEAMSQEEVQGHGKNWMGKEGQK